MDKKTTAMYYRKMVAMGGDNIAELAAAIELSPKTLENALMAGRALGTASMIRLEAYLLAQKEAEKGKK